MSDSRVKVIDEILEHEFVDEPQWSRIVIAKNILAALDEHARLDADDA